MSSQDLFSLRPDRGVHRRLELGSPTLQLGAKPQVESQQRELKLHTQPLASRNSRHRSGCKRRRGPRQTPAGSRSNRRADTRTRKSLRAPGACPGLRWPAVTHPAADRRPDPAPIHRPPPTLCSRLYSAEARRILRPRPPALKSRPSHHSCATQRRSKERKTINGHDSHPGKPQIQLGGARPFVCLQYFIGNVASTRLQYKTTIQAPGYIGWHSLQHQIYIKAIQSFNPRQCCSPFTLVIVALTGSYCQCRRKRSSPVSQPATDLARR